MKNPRKEKAENVLCEGCGTVMKHYDWVKRKIKMGGDEFKIVEVERVYCKRCGCFKRILPPGVMPFKQYSIDIFNKALVSDIFEDSKYEDYPCEMTIKRWRRDVFH